MIAERTDYQSGAFTLVELLATIAVVTVLAAMLLGAVASTKQATLRTTCLSNLRQLGLGSLMYSDDNANGVLSSTKNDTDDDQNWLYPNYVSNLKTFICPNLDNAVRTESAKRNPLTGLVYLDDLTHYAHHGNGFGSAYEVFGFMHFNGSELTQLVIDGIVTNVPGVRKTISTVQTYQHESNAFGLRGTIAGPSRIWLLLDGDDGFGNYPSPDGNHGTRGLNVEFCDGHVEWITRPKWALSYELSQDEGITEPPR